MGNRIAKRGLMRKMREKGTLYIISAPSGAGKTSLVAALLPKLNNVKLSTSYTTRARREKEKEEIDYFFIHETLFEQMVKARRFMEHAKVFGHYYGTSHEWVAKTLAAGTDVILEIDWQGARQCHIFQPDSVLIFILPPSKMVLKKRLEQRRQDSPEVIAERMAEAEKEISHCHEYDYIVINDDFETALDDLKAIFVSNRLKTHHQLLKNKPLLKEMLL